MPVEWKMDFVSTTQILLKKKKNKVPVPVSSHFAVAAYICETSRIVKSLANPGWILILLELDFALQKASNVSFVGYLCTNLSLMLKLIV